MFKHLEKDRNPIRILAITLLVLLCGASIYLTIYHKSSTHTVFSLIGIVCNLVGALWIASGVYLFSTDKNDLEKVSPNKGKYAKKIAVLLNQASRTIPLGMSYMLVGSFYQVLVLAGSA